MARRVMVKTLVAEAFLKQWMQPLIAAYMEVSRDQTSGVDDDVLLPVAELWLI